MPNLWIVDYVVMGLHLSIMVGIGIFFYKHVKSTDDFFKSGNKLPWGVAGLSSFMSSFSAWTFTGGAGKIYTYGISGELILWASAFALLLAYFFLASKWRRSRVITITQFLQERYNKTTHQFYSWLYVLMKLFIVGLQLLASSVFISVALNINLSYVIIIAGLTMLSYSVLSGLWVVSTNDTLQFIIVTSITIIAAPLSLKAIGGIDALVSKAPENYFAIGNGDVDMFYLFGWLLLMFFGNNSNASVQRYFSVEDEKAARKVALLSSVLFFAGVALWMIPAMSARIMFPDLSGYVAGLNKPSEASYVVMCMKVLPHGLMGLLLAAIFAATMSSLDSSYNVMAAVIVEDFYAKYVKPNSSKKHLLLVSRLTILGIGIATVLLALYLTSHKGGVFGVMKDISQVLTVPIASALLLGLLIRRTPPWTALVAFVLTFIVAYFTRYVFDLHLGLQAVLVVSTSVLIFLIMKIWWKKTDTEDRERIDKFFERLDTPVQKDKELAEGTTGDVVSMLRVIGTLLMIVGGIILFPVIYLTDIFAIIITCGLASIMLIAGSIMFFKGKRKE